MKPILFARIFASLVFGSLTVTTPVVRAQIVPDNTLPSASLVEAGCTDCTITGGMTQGSNLFHSFQEFSVPTGGAAFFNSAPQIQNILTRVTGSSISNIDGLLRSPTTTNLFLINPNGVIFGPNARLDIGGSFVASTANSILLENGLTFTTINPQAPPLLTVDAPVGLQYGANPGSITVQGSELEVSPGQTLALVGSGVALNGGGLTAAGGRIELGSVGAGGLVAIAPTNLGWQLNYQNAQQFQDIQLNQGATVSASSSSGGSIQVQGRRLSLTEGSGIFTATRGSQTGQNLTIRATESVEVSGFNSETGFPSVLSTQASRGSTGDSGNLTIETGILRVINGGQVINNNFGAGRGGDITVQAHQIEVVGFNPEDNFASRLAAQAGPDSTSNTGNLIITTGTLRLADGAVVTTRSFGSGDSGDITVRAQSVDVVGIHPQTGVHSFLGTQSLASGNAGNLTIETGTLSVVEGAQVSTATFENSNSGNITIRAQVVDVIGVGSDRRSLPSLLSTAALGETGNAGNLLIETGTLHVVGGATVTTVTVGAGTGGDITVRAQAVDVIGFDPRELFPSTIATQTDSTGNAGDLSIETGRLYIAEGANISTTTFNAGEGGNLTVQAESVEVIGSNPQDGVSSAIGTQTASTGDAGNLSIATGILRVAAGARVTTDTVGAGDSGNITIQAQSVDVTGFDLQDGSLSLLTTQADSDATGNAGGIVLNSDRLSLTNRGAIIARSAGTGSAGNIELQVVSQIALVDAANINSNTNAGQGNIILNTPLLLLRRGSSITTNASGEAAGGNINFNGNFVVAALSEDSDITANAIAGSGGRVDITAQGIFGIEPRLRATQLSDITASSEFGIAGIVTINTPNTDLDRELAELPTDVIDASRLVALGCASPTTAQANRGEFYRTGRGGIAPLPTDALGSSDILEDFQPPDTWTGATPPEPIQEAEGWQVNERGQVVLVATTHQRYCGR